MADRFDDQTDHMSEDPRIFEALDLFLKLRRSAHTRRAYRNDLMGYFQSFQARNFRLSELRTLGRLRLQTSVLNFVMGFAKYHAHSDTPINGTTLNRKRYTISKFYRFLIDQFGFFYNPASQLPTYPKLRESVRNRLSEADIIQIMSYLKKRHRQSEADFRNYLVVLGLFHFALRRHELVALRWDAILEQPLRHFYVQQKGFHIKRLPIPAPYWKLLNQFRKAFPSESPYLFRPSINRRSGDCNKPICTNTVLNIVQAIGKAIEFRGPLTPHDFRAAFVSIARQCKLDTKTIMNATGHSSAAMIDYYDIREHLETNAVHYFTALFKKY